jgi:hypothetical protein
MGIRKSRQTQRLGVGGWGAIRSSHQYDPYVVTFHCTSVSPALARALTVPHEGLGGVGGPAV